MVIELLCLVLVYVFWKETLSCVSVCMHIIMIFVYIFDNFLYVSTLALFFLGGGGSHSFKLVLISFNLGIQIPVLEFSPQK